MPSRAREKQLAKQHARRQAERQQFARRKKITAGIVGGVIGLGAIAIGIAILSGDEPGPQASGTPSTSVSVPPSVTVTPAPSGKPGLPQKVGEVTPEVTPPATVACGGAQPPSFGEPKGQYDAPPKPGKVLADGAGYHAVVKTSCGAYEMELYSEDAPQAVASFVFLAREGFFDGLTFHRVVPGFVIQGGDPLGTGTGGPGYRFGDEIDPKIVFDREGLLAMANSGPGTNGSQWFVTLGGADAAGHLNGLHTIFGEVTDGMDVVLAIGAVAPDASGAPSEAVYIESVTITETPSPEPSPQPSASTGGG